MGDTKVFSKPQAPSYISVKLSSSNVFFRPTEAILIIFLGAMVSAVVLLLGPRGSPMVEPRGSQATLKGDLR